MQPKALFLGLLLDRCTRFFSSGSKSNDEEVGDTKSNTGIGNDRLPSVIQCDGNGSIVRTMWMQTRALILSLMFDCQTELGSTVIIEISKIEQSQRK